MKRKPAYKVTDRMKRYRANQDIAGPRLCVFCGATKDLQADHIDGFEEHGESDNLMWLCRSCNQRKSSAFKEAGMGRRTVQYNAPTYSNPEFVSVLLKKRNPAKSYAEWSHAVGVLRGELPGSAFRAMRVIRSTHPSERVKFGRVAGRKNPGAHTLGAWVNALMIAKGEAAGDRKAAQELIHETPKSRRSDFQREVWGIRKDRYGPSGRQGHFFDEVPF